MDFVREEVWQEGSLEKRRVNNRIASRSDSIDALRAALALWVIFAHLVPWAGVTGQHVPALLRYLMQGVQDLFQPTGELHPAGRAA